ncbi:MAG: alpha/beta hydrolase, partial [Paracoccaceae bacterium]
MRNDEAFANAKYIPGGEEYYAIWQGKATRLRMALSTRCELNIPYGSGPSHWYDLFAPDGEAQGLMIFVHGGYWMETGPRDYTHLAQGALSRGWSVAMPSYSLAPAVRIGAMVTEIVAAVEM